MDYPYTPPSFLKEQSADKIHNRMLEALPSGIDKSENSVAWDYTRPSALEKAEFVQFELNETIRLIFPQWSYGDWLALHAEKENVYRREANKASGILNVKGIIGTVIPLGFQFATPAKLAPSVLFETTEEITLDGIPDSRGQVSVEVHIQAVEGGVAGNVVQNSVRLMARPISGIVDVTNPEAITGGTAAEDDKSLIQRVLDAMRLGGSFVGNNADYIRWAKEVAGVGQVIVVPEALGASTVLLIIVDSNGIPANQQILDAVYSHIMGAGVTDTERLAPIGAILTVIAPTALEMNISATILIENDEPIEAITERFNAALTAYWLAVAQEAHQNTTHTGCVRIVQVGAILAKTVGVSDYFDLTINGGTDNIVINQDQFPVTGEVVLNA